MRTLISLLVLCVVVVASSDIDGCSGRVNSHPIATTPPVLVKTVKNGKLYRHDAVSPPLLVPHVFGTAYEMGYAQGELLKYEITKNLGDFEAYIEKTIVNYLSDLPVWLAKLIAEGGASAALDATYYMTEAYTPKHFLDEIRGVSDATGLDYMRLVRLMQFPELIKAACSMFGAWGPAVAHTTGSLYQLRALDWATDGPLQQFPTVVFYHPTDGGHPFSIVSWAGFLGAVSGWSSAPVAVCEKVWLHYNGTSSRIGYPWHFLLRDILQFDQTNDDALNRIINAERTCSIFVGLGDSSHQFRVVEYAHEYIKVYDDKNYPVYENHPQMEGLVYVDKHTQPSTHPCYTKLLQKYYGNLTPENTIHYIASQFQTGDMHAIVYDFAEMQMYVANAGTNGTMAYDNPYVRLDMNAMFSVKKP